MAITISSRKAAEILNFNESTIKRWADSGKIKCFRTPGGHRKFNLDDIRKLAEDHKLENTKTEFFDSRLLKVSVIKKHDFKYLNKEFTKHILKGDTESTYSFLYELFQNDYSHEEVFDNIVKESMTRIGVKWKENKLGIQNEHVAANTVISSLYKLEKFLFKKRSNNKTAVCAGFENEFHEIGLLCVRITLESAGWNVIYPGINLPAKSLTELIEKTKPDLVCLTTNFSGKNKTTENEISKIRNSCKDSECRLIIGGRSSLELKSLSGISLCTSIADFKNQLKII